MNKAKTILYIISAVALISAYGMAYVGSARDITITVKDKERITTGSGEDLKSKYLVYTDKEVFENTDTILFGKYNSSDFQGKLDVGKTYKVKVAGWRIPIFSSYRNIVKLY